MRLIFSFASFAFVRIDVNRYLAKTKVFEIRVPVDRRLLGGRSTVQKSKASHLPVKTSLTRVYPLSRRDIIRNCRLGQRAEPGYLSELTLPVSGVTCHGFFTSSDVASPRVVFEIPPLCASGSVSPGCS